MRSTWIDAALPKGKLKLDRALIIPAVIRLIEEWQAHDKHAEIEPDAIRQMATIYDGLEAAIGGDLAHGDSLDRVAERASERLLALNAAAPYSRGHSLFLACQQIRSAIDEMRTWNKAHRPRNHRPRTGLVTRVWELRDLCRRQAGMKPAEFELFLDEFNHKSGLSELHTETWKQARHRARKKSR
jgi:hypothetical protein